MNLLIFLPVGVLLWCLYLKIEDREVYTQMVLEDGFFEVLTAVAYLGAVVPALLVSRLLFKQRKNGLGWLYLLAAFGFLFVCLEEISWGQRILGINPPFFFAHNNKQREISAHNFLEPNFLHLIYIIVGFYATFARKLWPKKLREKYPDAFQLMAPEWKWFFYFFPLFLIYVYFDYFSPAGWWPQAWKWSPRRFMVADDQEPVELLAALGVLFFVFQNYLRLSKEGAHRISKTN